MIVFIFKHSILKPLQRRSEIKCLLMRFYLSSISCSFHGWISLSQAIGKRRGRLPGTTSTPTSSFSLTSVTAKLSDSSVWEEWLVKCQSQQFLDGNGPIQFAFPSSHIKLCLCLIVDHFPHKVFQPHVTTPLSRKSRGKQVGLRPFQEVIQLFSLACLFVLFIFLTCGKTSDVKHRAIAQTLFRRYRQYHVRLFFYLVF